MSIKQRIAKAIAAAGVCSRRDAEKLIAEAKVKLNGSVVLSPATLVTERDDIRVEEKPLVPSQSPRLWIFFKPTGVITTNKDPQGRKTIFDLLPATLPRVITIGRLDLNSEGLLLLTNSGELARKMELPSTKIERRYRCRVYGNVTAQMITKLSQGIVMDDIRYGNIFVKSERVVGSHTWVSVNLHEGKNREIRRAFEYFNLKVNRLIRIGFDEFELGSLKPSELKEVPRAAVRELFQRLSIAHNIRERLALKEI